VFYIELVNLNVLWSIIGHFFKFYLYNYTIFGFFETKRNMEATLGFTEHFPRIMSIVMEILGPAAAPPLGHGRQRHQRFSILENTKTNKSSEVLEWIQNLEIF
jgi:hypothetical protein